MEASVGTFELSKKRMAISVIIPVYNEAGVIGRTVQHLLSSDDNNKLKEVIVVDGGSTDGSQQEATNAGAVVVRSSRKGRATQMNEGANRATESILYFLHADSLPPPSFPTDIIGAVDRGYLAGCYRLRFDVEHWFLKVNTWFTRFDVNAFRFGDQSLFVTREVFFRAGGFCEKHIVMEDQEIIKRLRIHGNFKVLQKEVTTSARKYVANGVFRMQGVFYLIYLMYQLGYSQDRLIQTFQRLVKQDKL